MMVGVCVCMYVCIIRMERSHRSVSRARAYVGAVNVRMCMHVYVCLCVGVYYVELEDLCFVHLRYVSAVCVCLCVYVHTVLYPLRPGWMGLFPWQCSKCHVCRYLYACSFMLP